MKQIATLLMISIPFLAQARICNSLNSGDWTSAATWSCGSAPAPGDTLNILQGHTVAIYSNLSYSGARMWVNVHGTWRFNGPGDKITMPCNSVVFIHTTGTLVGTGVPSGNSQTITICNTVYWDGSGDPVTGPVAYPITVMPVEFLDFTGEATEAGVSLRWSTATETSSSHFEIHRSDDLENWTALGTVDAAGNSTSIQDYELFDHTVYRGTWYYRLKQVDNNGTPHGNRLLGIEVLGRRPSLTCVPNPVTDGRMQAVVGELIDVDPMPTLCDLATGRISRVTDHKVHGDRVAVFFPSLANGTYALTLQLAEGQRTCRFVVQH